MLKMFENGDDLSVLQSYSIMLRVRYGRVSNSSLAKTSEPLTIQSPCQKSEVGWLGPPYSVQALPTGAFTLGCGVSWCKLDSEVQEMRYLPPASGGNPQSDNHSQRI